MLDLVALSYNELPPVVPIRGVIPDDGGTIGRDAENTISLPDPVRLVSRKHGRFGKDNGSYFIANISDGNSFFVNEREVSAGTKCALADGDLLQIGGYVLRIRLSENKKNGVEAKPVAADVGSVVRNEPLAAKPAAAPVAAQRTTSTFDLGGSGGNSLPGPFDDLLAAPVPPPSELLTPPASKRAEPSRSASPQLIPADFDPFLDGNNAPKDKRIEERSADGHEFDPVMPKLSPFSVVKDDPEIAKSSIEAMLAPNAPASENTLLTDSISADPLALFSDVSSRSDLLDELAITREGGSIELASDLSTSFKLPAAQNPDPFQSIPQDAFQIPIPDLTEAADITAGLEEPITAPPPPVPQSAMPAPTPTPTPIAAPPAPPAAVAAEKAPLPKPEVQVAPANPAPTPELAELKRALEAGLQAQLPGDATSLNTDTMRLIGALLRVAITGSLDLMRARSAVKKEVRVEMTVIEPNDNNPLKFSPDADVAIQYMFGRKYPGFLGPLDAMSEAYLDLASHQMAMVAGMRSAMDEVIQRFDPERIEKEIDTKKMLSRLSDVHRRSELWAAYCGRYQGIADVLGKDFQDYYAQAFTRAYEEEAAGRKQTGGRT